MDPGIDPAPTGQVTTLLAAGARLYLGGTFGVSALDPGSGAPDQAFRTATDFTPGSLSLAGGRLFAVPAQRFYSSSPPASFDATTGQRSETFDASVVGSARVVLGSGGGVLVAGDFIAAGGERRNRLAAIDSSSGALVSSFRPNVENRRVEELSVSGGRIFLRGTFSRVNGQSRRRMAAVSKSIGRLDRRFRPAFIGGVNAIRPARRRVFVGGYFTKVGGRRRRVLVALSSRSGRLDRRFRPRIQPRRKKGFYAEVLALATRGRRVFVGGVFARVNGRRRANLVALDHRTGRVARSFRGQANRAVTTLVSSGSRLYVGGAFSRLSGRRQRFLGRLSARTGRLDRRFRPRERGLRGPLVLGQGRIFSSTYSEIRELSTRSGRLTRTHNIRGLDGELRTLAASRVRLFIGGSIGGSTEPSDSPLGLSGLTALQLRR